MGNGRGGRREEGREEVREGRWEMGEVREGRGEGGGKGGKVGNRRGRGG